MSGGTTMVIDFCLPSPEQSLLEAIQMWDNKSIAGLLRLFLPHGRHLVGREGVRRDAARRRERASTSFKHFMAYKGALMVDDDEMYSSFQRVAEVGGLPMVHAENGDVVAQLQQKLLAEGNNGPEAHAYSRPPEVEGEGHQPAPS